MTRPSTSRGFTLIELMIVLSLIATIAVIGIPNLLASRLSANESAAIATLRTIASGQLAAASRLSLDNDSDGIGEYLYLAELGGVVNLRGQAFALDPTAVSVSISNVQNGSVNKSGYRFAIHLPDAAGLGVAEDNAGGKAVAAAVDSDYCETFWVCYAWPAAFNGSGRRAFVINQSGNILQSDNQAQRYDGLTTVPAAAAAFTGAPITSELAISNLGAPAQDGGLWLPLN